MEEVIRSLQRNHYCEQEPALDVDRMTDEEFEDEINRAFDLATNAMDATFKRGDLAPDLIDRMIREFRASHPYQP